jgi:tetratricopeptide (TPR) repeat protein
MNKVLVALLLLVTAGISLASPMPPAMQQAGQKTIKDPGEYNAYITAFNTQDPAQKAALMEAFLKQYPDSIVKTDAMENAMAAYQQAGNQAKVEEMAKTLLKSDAKSVRALAILAYLARAKGTPEAAREGRGYSETGLTAMATWAKPEGMSDDDFGKLRTQMSFIFNGAAGFGALQNKEFDKARDYYGKALAIDMNSLQDAYQDGIAELSMTPQDLTGYWHIAKAQALAQAQNNAAGAKAIGDYGKGQYKRYHGSEDGWDKVASLAMGQSTPPPQEELAKLITPKPTPCDIAVQAVNDAVKNDGVKDLSFGDYEFVLQQRDCSAAGKQAAETIWKYIQDKQKGGEAKLKLVGVKVIAATTDAVDAALTEENQKDNKADLHVVLEKPVTKPPAVGSTTDVTGVITSYTPEPFLFTMEKAELPAAAKPVPPRPRPGAKGKSSAGKPAARKSAG